MTVQEAIEVLSEIRSGYNCFDESEKPYYEALSEAIEALTHFNSTSNSIKNELNELSCSEKPNRSEPKTSESGSVDSEMPEIKTDRTIGGMIYRQDAIDALWEKRQALNDIMDKYLQDDLLVLRQQTKIERNRIEEDINIIEELPPVHPEPYRGDS